MPRQRRIEIPGEIHHVMARGLDGMDILADGRDREVFLESLGRYLKHFDNRCYAWVLMDNHYHLLIRISGANLGMMMRRLNGSYARYFNKRYQRRGYVFMDRYKSVATQEAGYFMELIRYIHLNPIRGGVVKNLSRLAKYPWSSHHDYVGRPRYDWCFIEESLRRFGGKRAESMPAYLQFLSEGIGETDQEPDQLMPLSSTAPGGDSRVAGDPEFIRSALKAEKSRRARLHDLRRRGIGIDHLAGKVCSHFKIGIDDIRKQARGNERADARTVLAHLARTELGLSLREIGDYLGVSETGATLAEQRGKSTVAKLSLNIKI